MANQQTQWTNLDAEVVDCVHEDRAHTVPVYAANAEYGVTLYDAGNVVTISPDSGDGLTKVDMVAADGDVATHLIRIANAESEALLSAYVLQPGLEFIIPTSALADGVSLTPGDELVAGNDGSLAAKAQPTDWVVFKALSDSTGDYFRALTICGQTPTA